MTRSGFVGLAGRPNVGKSTLVNQIVGSHVAIVSMRPQTTRRAIRGIHTDVEGGRQLVLVDLPGVQRPRDVLGAGAKLPIICAVNKADQLGPNEMVPVLAEAAELGGVDEVFPISARSGEGVDVLVERMAELMPEGLYLYPPEDHSDQSSELLLAELIREQVLNRTRDEIPHSVEVSVKEVSPPRPEDGLVEVTAEIWAE